MLLRFSRESVAWRESRAAGLEERARNSNVNAFEEDEVGGNVEVVSVVDGVVVGVWSKANSFEVVLEAAVDGVVVGVKKDLGVCCCSGEKMFAFLFSSFSVDL